MGAHSYEDLKRHVGHEIKCVVYAAGHEYAEDPQNVAVECWTCHEVLLDFDRDHPESEDKKLIAELVECLDQIHKRLDGDSLNGLTKWIYRAGKLLERVRGG